MSRIDSPRSAAASPQIPASFQENHGFNKKRLFAITTVVLSVLFVWIINALPAYAGSDVGACKKACSMPSNIQNSLYFTPGEPGCVENCISMIHFRRALGDNQGRGVIL